MEVYLSPCAFRLRSFPVPLLQAERNSLRQLSSICLYNTDFHLCISKVTNYWGTLKLTSDHSGSSDRLGTYKRVPFFNLESSGRQSRSTFDLEICKRILYSCHRNFSCRAHRLYNRVSFRVSPRDLFSVSFLVVQVRRTGVVPCSALSVLQVIEVFSCLALSF